MKLALDPQLFYSTSSVYELPDIVASLGYGLRYISNPPGNATRVHQLSERQRDKAISVVAKHFGDDAAASVSSSKMAT